MSHNPKPSPCYLDALEKWKVVKGTQIWRSSNGRRLYTWDGMHGEIEVFDKQGLHLGAVDAVLGTLIKEAVRGRSIDI